MPKRRTPLVNNEIYHIINRGIASQPIFKNKKNYERALNIFFYYQNRNVPIKYSHFIVEPKEKKEKIIQKLTLKKDFLAEVIAYCLMPNHFHFLLKQKINNGISKLLANFTNSYVHYFNSKNERKSHLFQGRFQAVRIETEEQLLHVSRYIHLNPYSSYVVKDLESLANYPFSSLPEYLEKADSEVCQKQAVLSCFKNRSQYKQFVFNQADYQKRLDQIKHLLLES